MNTRTILKRGVAAFAMVVALLLMVACFDRTENSLTNSPTQVILQAPPSPAASPSPIITTPQGTPATVRVTEFGDAPPGCSHGIARQAPVGCTKILTCTPRKADGSDYWAGVDDATIALHPPTFFGAFSGEGVIVRTTAPGNQYNRDALALAVGAAPYGCTVQGVASVEAYVLTVVP